MRKRSKQGNHPNQNQIQVSFVKQNKQLSVQQNRLNVEILRVHTIQKQRFVQQVFSYSQQQLCQYFSNYQLFPYNNVINLKELLNCSNLKLIKNQDKIYFGQVEKKKRAGKGVNISNDGKIYQGQFVNNQKFGIGVEIYPNGNLFLGQFQNGKKHGQGQFFWFSLSSKNPKQDQFVEYYDGEWWGGLPDGQGVHQKINGDLYTGSFKNGLKHGEGIQYFSNRDTYKGQYVNGLPQGYGQYFWSDKSYYKGDFKQGLRNGYGVWSLGQKSDQKYKGHYCMDKKAGYGVYQWQNGWTYKGNFDSDLRNGFGQLYDGSKLTYRGFWKNGQQTEEQVKNSKGMIEHSQSKFFTKSNSQIYNRKVGSHQNLNHQHLNHQNLNHQNLNQQQSYGIQFNPEDRIQNRKKNKSASKRKVQDNNWNDFGTITYQEQYVLKKRPQSFNSGKGSNAKRANSTQRKNPRSTMNFDNLSKMKQTRTNFAGRETGRTMSMNYQGGISSTIGSTITRPLMKNPNMGNLYIPHNNNRSQHRPQHRPQHGPQHRRVDQRYG